MTWRRWRSSIPAVARRRSSWRKWRLSSPVAGCWMWVPVWEARLLAARFGCLVTALDLTGEYCRAAQMLNKATGLADRVMVRQGSALALPFADGAFDGARTQHASMNIRDKLRLYAQIRRVLR